MSKKKISKIKMKASINKIEHEKEVTKKKINSDAIIKRIVALMESGQQFIPIGYISHTYGEIERRLNEFREVRSINFTKFKVRGNIYEYRTDSYSLHLVKKEPYVDVYVITTIYSCDDLANGYRSRVVGWYPAIYQAKKVATSNRYDINEGMYNYCVIEKFSPGIYPNVEQEWWFEWDDVNKKYKSIAKKPDLFDHYTNFGIG